MPANNNNAAFNTKLVAAAFCRPTRVFVIFLQYVAVIVDANLTPNLYIPYEYSMVLIVVRRKHHY